MQSSFGNEPCSVDPDADVNFKLNENDLMEVFLVMPEIVELPSIAKFVKAQSPIPSVDE